MSDEIRVCRCCGKKFVHKPSRSIKNICDECRSGEWQKDQPQEQPTDRAAKEREE